MWLNKKFINSVSGDTLKYKTQIKKLDKLNSAHDVDAKKIQKYARVTKWILRENIKHVREDPNSIGGKIHDNSQVQQQINIAKRAYQLAKAIQHNDGSWLR